MSFFDKLKFWQHDDIPPLPEAIGKLPPLPGDHPGLALERADVAEPQGQPFIPSPSPSFSAPPMQQVPQAPQMDMMMNKNMEIISSKLDMLQKYLESISQRLMNIERIAQQEQQQTKKQW